MWLGLRRLAQSAPDARTLYQIPEPARRLTQGELPGPTPEELETQAWTPAGASNAVRLALRARLTARGIVRAFQ
jgi:hypothetical protein